MKNTGTSNATKKVWFVTGIENAESIKVNGITRLGLCQDIHFMTDLEIKDRFGDQTLYIPDYEAFQRVTYFSGSLKYLLVEIDAEGINGKYLPDQGDNGNISKYLRRISQWQIEPQYILSIEEKEINLDKLIEFSNERIFGLREEAEKIHEILSPETLKKKYGCRAHGRTEISSQNRYLSEIRATARLNRNIIKYFHNPDETAYDVYKKICLVA